MEQIIKISGFVFNSFIHIWPYLIITIPLAVIIQFYGASKYINKAFSYSPLISVLLATAVGAFSPFCSCGVIPVIASLLIGGVPLAPVMSFWIASPSMDPEIFLLSVATIGWDLSIWRLAATFIISLLAGYLTHLIFQKGMQGTEIIREKRGHSVTYSLRQLLSDFNIFIKRIFLYHNNPQKVYVQIPTEKSKFTYNLNCCYPIDENRLHELPQKQEKENLSYCTEVCENESISSRRKIVYETWKASAMVVKFMLLALIINALIQFYIPQEFISDLLGRNSSFSVIVAAITGIPVYTSNITALPLINGLLTMGMNKGAALAFLISGPVTTLPAMVAVWGIVKRKVFLLYISFAVAGAILTGLVFNFIH